MKQDIQRMMETKLTVWKEYAVNNINGYIRKPNEKIEIDRNRALAAYYDPPQLSIGTFSYFLSFFYFQIC